MTSTAVVWFRNDLRLEMNPAWSSATAACDAVIPVVVVDPDLLASVGPFRRNLFLANVAALDSELQALGGRLSVLIGEPTDLIPELCAAVEATSLHFNRAASGFGRTRDNAIAAKLHCEHRTFWGTLLTEPGTVLTGKGTLSKVFTPFWKQWAKTTLPVHPNGGDATLTTAPESFLQPLPSFDEPIIAPGNQGAHAALNRWLESVDDYLDTRDLPAVEGTSQLSAHLRFGTISPRTIFDVVGSSSAGRDGFVRQLAWRDWYAHMLLERPAMITAAVKPEYDDIDWRDDPDGLAAWKAGQTGYPLVDAGMRQLAQTGWMHNRVRMVVGSFLVKHLLIDWREGERWFRHLLIDAEPSQNAGNWQWVAGTGTDAAPYFRVFNPIAQSQKFDGGGDYIRRWVPELAGLDKKQIHAPWEAAPLDLASNGVVLGDTYPHPIVEHKFARERVLTAYKTALGKS